MRNLSQYFSAFHRGLVVLILLVVAALSFSTAFVQTQETSQQDRPVWHVQLATNSRASSNITLRNLCKKSHSFTIIEQATPYLTLLANATTNVSGHSTQNVPVRFNTEGMKPGEYTGNVLVKCENCQKEKGCQQDREVLPLRLTVVENAAGTKPAKSDEWKIPNAPGIPETKNNPSGPIAGGPGPLAQPTPSATPLTPTATADGEVCKWIAYKTYRVEEWKREQSTDKNLEVRHQSAKGGGVTVEYHCKAAGTFIFTVTKENAEPDVVSVTCTQP